MRSTRPGACRVLPCEVRRQRGIRRSTSHRNNVPRRLAKAAAKVFGRKPFVELRRLKFDAGSPFVLDRTIATHWHRRAKMPEPDPRIVHERSAAHRQGLPFQSSAQLAHAAAGMGATAGMGASSVLAVATLWLAVLGRASAHHRYTRGHWVGWPGWHGAGPVGSRRQ